MSIKDDVMEVSENNVTIAENLEKVYNAGMRAGLAQDPDYAEGYDDGYEQGLTDSSGVVWEDLLSGKVPVGKAKEADHADRATNAENAENAKNANHAKSADNATNANRATEANHAMEADHSTNADHATEADHSTNADHATNADKANTAVSADHATTATVANSANSFNGVLPIEEGGTGANNPIDALKNLGQKPWDVNENLGSIVSNTEHSINIVELSHSEGYSGSPWTTVTLDEPIPDFPYNYGLSWKLTKADIIAIPVINSGDIHIKYKYECHFENLSYGRYCVNIYKNNTKLHTDIILDADDFENSDPDSSGEIITPSLRVNKGDTIRIEVEFKYLFGENVGVERFYHIFDGDRDTCIENIDILANIDTPYKYVSLVNINEPSAAEILNALLGV